MMSVGSCAQVRLQTHMTVASISPRPSLTSHNLDLKTSGVNFLS